MNNPYSKAAEVLNSASQKKAPIIDKPNKPTRSITFRDRSSKADTAFMSEASKAIIKNNSNMDSAHLEGVLSMPSDKRKRARKLMLE